jgi:2-haloacid dehalogenase
MSRFPFCAFDAYGTLFDLGSVVEGSAARLGEKAPHLLALWRQKQLEATWLRSLMRRHEPFDAVTASALRFAMAELGVDDPGLERDLLGGFRTVSPYSDVRPALESLRRAGVRCAVLSNGTPSMLEAALAASGLGPLLDPVLSVEAVGIYKPDPRVYALLERAAGLPRPRIAFVSANRWDVGGAASYGLSVVWVNRAGARPEPLPGEPMAEIQSLFRLPELLAG